MSTTLVLIDLNSQASYEFQFFPNMLSTEDAANWEEQDTAGGTKPLFYMNRSPQMLTFPELYLDNTDTGQSLAEQIKELRSFCFDEVPDTGAPAPLLATWGDENLRCVVTRLSTERIYFNESGEPTRARMAMDLKELQEFGEGTGVSFGI